MTKKNRNKLQSRQTVSKDSLSEMNLTVLQLVDIAAIIKCVH